jgi:hypothetical protein
MTYKKRHSMHVDGHEKAEQRFKKYLTELEPHMHRWVQLH